jgi:hypothetical protein
LDVLSIGQEEYSGFGNKRIGDLLTAPKISSFPQSGVLGYGRFSIPISLKYEHHSGLLSTAIKYDKLLTWARKKKFY